jgi:hypothetical protein
LPEGPEERIADLVRAADLFSGDPMRGCTYWELILKKLDFFQ